MQDAPAPGTAPAPVARLVRHVALYAPFAALGLWMMGPNAYGKLTADPSRIDGGTVSFFSMAGCVGCRILWKLRQEPWSIEFLRRPATAMWFAFAGACVGMLGAVLVALAAFVTR